MPIQLKNRIREISKKSFTKGRKFKFKQLYVKWHAFRTSVRHHLIINNKLSNHNLYASNFNYVKFSPSLSLVKKKKKKDQNSSPNGDRTRRYYKAKMRNNFATREQSVKPCESSFADKFPSLICIRAICKPVCYIRARGGRDKEKERREGARAKPLFLPPVIEYHTSH